MVEESVTIKSRKRNALKITESKQLPNKPNVIQIEFTRELNGLEFMGIVKAIELSLGN